MKVVVIVLFYFIVVLYIFNWCIYYCVVGIIKVFIWFYNRLFFYNVCILYFVRFFVCICYMLIMVNKLYCFIIIVNNGNVIGKCELCRV